jgi:hypothetical protein
MNLDEAQKRIVAGWIAEGLRLSDIQKRLASDLGVTLTYMEVRFLVDDLKLTPKDVEPPKSAQLGGPQPNATSPGKAPTASQQTSPLTGETPHSPGGVSLTVDEISRPGAVASGKVTFSDGKTAEWYLDQTGRLGLLPEQTGYRPSPRDVQQFQSELQNELAKLGY